MSCCGPIDLDDTLPLSNYGSSQRHLAAGIWRLFTSPHSTRDAFLAWTCLLRSTAPQRVIAVRGHGGQTAFSLFVPSWACQGLRAVTPEGAAADGRLQEEGGTTVDCLKKLLLDNGDC
jgi:hypothetical protein